MKFGGASLLVLLAAVAPLAGATAGIPAISGGPRSSVEGPSVSAERSANSAPRAAARKSSRDRLAPRSRMASRTVSTRSRARGSVSNRSAILGRPISRFVGAGATPSGSITGDAAPASGPGQGALIVAIDPETGAPTTPTAEQVRALAQSSPPRPVEPLTLVVLPDGTKMVKLGERFLQYEVAVVDSNGRARTRCVHDPAAAERLVREPSVRAVAPTE